MELATLCLSPAACYYSDLRASNLCCNLIINMTRRVNMMKTIINESPPIPMETDPTIVNILLEVTLKSNLSSAIFLHSLTE